MGYNLITNWSNRPEVVNLNFERTDLCIQHTVPSLETYSMSEEAIHNTAHSSLLGPDSVLDMSKLLQPRPLNCALENANTVTV
jgi:hypothetical protein